MASRILQQSARRFAVAKPSAISTSKSIIPASTLLLQARPASTSHSGATQVPRDESLEILVRQRLSRPVAPHLTIYKPQITWYLSMLNRLTGITLSGGLYVFGLAYLAGPVLGYQLTSAAMAASFAKWPVIAKIGLKVTAAAPFFFHSFNGIRHLVWDTGRQMTNMQVIRTGWAVVALTAVGTIGAFFYQ